MCNSHAKKSSRDRKKTPENSDTINFIGECNQGKGAGVTGAKKYKRSPQESHSNCNEIMACE